MDWNQPYSCQGWASEFQQTLPILDDGSGANIYGLFGSGYVPHSAVIAGDGLVIYSQSGFNYNTMISIIEYGLSTLVLDADEDGIMDDVDNCMDDYNPNQVDTDEDGTGDLCDACNNLIFTDGDINGDLSLNVLDINGENRAESMVALVHHKSKAVMDFLPHRDNLSPQASSSLRNVS